MVERTLDDMGQDAEFCHARGGGAAQVIKRPVEICDLFGRQPSFHSSAASLVLDLGIQLAFGLGSGTRH